MHTVTGTTKLHNVMHRMGAQVHGLGANEPTCTPLATPLAHVHAQTNNVLFTILAIERVLNLSSVITTAKTNTLCELLN